MCCGKQRDQLGCGLHSMCVSIEKPHTYLPSRAQSPDETGADVRGSRAGNVNLVNSGCHDNAVVGRGDECTYTTYMCVCKAVMQAAVQATKDVRPCRDESGAPHI